jgi:hypothetical protein
MPPPAAAVLLAAPGNEVNRHDAEDAHLSLIVSVKVRNVMRFDCFGKHADYDSIEPA